MFVLRALLVSCLIGFSGVAERSECPEDLLRARSRSQVISAVRDAVDSGATVSNLSLISDVYVRVEKGVPMATIFLSLGWASGCYGEPSGPLGLIEGDWKRSIEGLLELHQAVGLSELRIDSRGVLLDNYMLRAVFSHPAVRSIVSNASFRTLSIKKVATSVLVDNVPANLAGLKAASSGKDELKFAR